jgi:heptosyltransferase I
LRLSAIGDTCHALAILRELQSAWPQTQFTWIIGKLEAKLMGIVPGIEFITFDKRQTRAELARLRALLRERHFDLLLHMQVAFRASLIAWLVNAPVKLGFDRPRARELQWLFTNRRIEAKAREHVLDSLQGFVRACGIEPGSPCWDFPLPPEAQTYAHSVITDARPVLLISPCSSHSERNWSAAGYAKVADHAVQAWGMHVVLAGGPSERERQTGAEIERLSRHTLTNQIGKDTLPQLLGLMARSQALITPDSGPAHMASMVGLPVIGLYAATNPARSGPYLSRALCVDKYAEAAQKFLGKSAGELPWNTKIEKPGVMDLIDAGDVIRQLDGLMSRGKN